MGHKGPRTTKELLNIATSHALGEEAVGAILDRSKGKAKRDDDDGEGASNSPHKKKNKQLCKSLLVATTDYKRVGSPTRAPPITSKSCSKDRAQTTPSPSST